MLATEKLIILVISISSKARVATKEKVFYLQRALKKLKYFSREEDQQIFSSLSDFHKKLVTMLHDCSDNGLKQICYYIYHSIAT